MGKRVRPLYLKAKAPERDLGYIHTPERSGVALQGQLAPGLW